MRKITDVYEEYKIMPNLQMHQLRVAAVASQICDSLDISIDKQTLVTACLLHDMGNIIKFDLIQTQEIFGFSEIEIQAIGKVKDDFLKKYGIDEHEATIQIAKELDMSERIVELVGENRFSFMCKHAEGDDIYLKIIHYADGRVGPHGILSYNERMNDAGIRYKDHKLRTEAQERENLVECGRDIEKQIFEHSNIKPEDINDKSVTPIIEILKGFEI